MKEYTDDLRDGYNPKIWDTRRAIVKDVRIVNDPIVNNGRCLKIGINAGYHLQEYVHFKDSERNELTENHDFRSSVGEISWYSFDVYFPEDFVINDNRLVFIQWKLEDTPPTHSPILSVKYINGSIRFQIGETDKKKNFKKKVDLRGLWSRIVVGLFIDNNGDGWIKGYYNEELVIDYSGTLKEDVYSNSIYMKFGLYRDSAEYSQYILFKNVRKSKIEGRVLE